MCCGVKEELQRTNLELDSFKEKIKENQEKIKLNKQLPYLVGNIVEVAILRYWQFVKKNLRFEVLVSFLLSLESFSN